MKLLFFCPRWGQEQTPWNIFLTRVKESGYDGVEASLPTGERERNAILNEFAKQNVLLIGQHWETVAADFDEHYKEYEMRLRSLAAAKPLFINTQTGKDYYSFEQNEKLIALAEKISSETGIKIIHETHRGKFSFAAHVTKQYLERLPNLYITLDISHWCNTAETFLHDQQEAVELAIKRTRHIHARVGYTEGPQVPDPRSPEYQQALEFHLSCWDKIIEKQKQNGSEQFTITPEFGAPPYMILLPHTNKPITDQWEVNKWMMDLLRKRYG